MHARPNIKNIIHVRCFNITILLSWTFLKAATLKQCPGVFFYMHIHKFLHCCNFYASELTLRVTQIDGGGSNNDCEDYSPSKRVGMTSLLVISAKTLALYCENKLINPKFINL